MCLVGGERPLGPCAWKRSELIKDATQLYPDPGLPKWDGMERRRWGWGGEGWRGVGWGGVGWGVWDGMG